MRKPESKNRRGVAAAEFAVCLPILVVMVFGAIEASSFIFLKQSLNVAAYEGIRTATRITGNEAAATGSANAILTSRNVNDFAIQFPGGDPGDVDRGDAITIIVSAPTDTNSPLLGQFIPNRLINAQIVMLKE